MIREAILTCRYLSSKYLNRKLKSNSFAKILYTFAALISGLSKKEWKLQLIVASD